ncbi:MAG TPA: aryl-sulfate sulfotransferase [Solirubrobacterales bacterium]
MPLTVLLLIAPGAAAALTAGDSAAKSGSCEGRSPTIRGTSGADRLRGTPSADVIVAGRGDDRIAGRGGADLICGGSGSDRLLGGPGADRLFGGGGDDTIDGGPKRDRCDGGGGSNSFERCETTIEPPVVRTTPINRLPEAGPVGSTTSEDEDVTIDLLAASSDPDGDALALGTIDTGETTGQVTATGPGLVTYSPGGTFEQLGAEGTATTSFGFEVGDGRGGSAKAVATVRISGVDDAPTAVDDEGVLTQDHPATALEVLANDTDVDGGPIAIAFAGDPAHGTATIDGATIHYTPDAGYCNDGEAADIFEYTLEGGSAATVSVKVACATSVSASPGLQPGFDPDVDDYVVDCENDPVQLSGRTSSAATITVEGEPIAGPFSESVPLEENQGFSFSIDEEGSVRAYNVRCLPEDFPSLSYEQFAEPQHELYSMITNVSPPFGRYVVIFDDRGVPVWWFGGSGQPNDPQILEDGTLAWFESAAAGYTVREPDGTVVRNVRIADGDTDFHELQQTAGGNFLVTAYVEREHVDLTEALGPGAETDAVVTDAVIEEIGPTGEMLWKWSSEGHVALSETGRWWPRVLSIQPRDIVHINAVEPVEADNAVLISLRHTDAVYKIDKVTGEVVWKLGGTWTPQSLSMVGDPEGAYPLGGQHDVRLLDDGTITISDNRTNLPGPPRAIRYAIDETAGTATLVEEVTDPQITVSQCCGSSRRSEDGSWLMSWGGQPLITEFDANGERTFALRFATGFSYRAVPAPSGAVTVEELRAGMDAMYPG